MNNINPSTPDYNDSLYLSHDGREELQEAYEAGRLDAFVERYANPYSKTSELCVSYDDGFDEGTQEMLEVFNEESPER